METKIEERMVGSGDPVDSNRIQTYSEREGEGVEGILRCAGCRRLVVRDKIDPRVGCPRCGNKRFNDVQAVNGREMFLIWVGWIDFPGRDKFLKEFSRV